MRMIVPVPLGWQLSLPIQMTRSPNTSLRAIAVFIMMPQAIADKKQDRWAMPQGRHGLFRFGAFIAARGHRPSINVRISPPEHLAHAYNAPPCSKFRFSRLLAAARAIA